MTGTELGLTVLLGLSWLVAGVLVHCTRDGWLGDMWHDRLPAPMPDDWCERTVQRSAR